MNTQTVKSKHPYHHVIIGADQKFVTLCITNNNGEGGFDHWRVDETGHERISGIMGNHFMQDYWIDYVPSEVITNVYKVLDFYVKEEKMEEAEKLIAPYSDFTADDIPF
jgi:hypothetical protein